MRLPHRVTIRRAETGSDRYNPTGARDWSLVVDVTTDGWLQPRSGSEDDVGGDLQIGDAVVYLPPSVEVLGTDRVVAGGHTWDVVGPPELWAGVDGLPMYQRAVLRRVEG